MMHSIRFFLRGFYRLYHGLVGFCYDISRFIRYASWDEDPHNSIQRNYRLAMLYHGLEKSLSYKNRDPESGWGRANEILDLLKIANKSSEVGFHDRAAKNVLESFISVADKAHYVKAMAIREEINKIEFSSDLTHGVIQYDTIDYEKGVLLKPEDFFLSRYSTREFSDKIIPDDIIRRGIKLSMKTPSVCNRQEWAIYHTSDEKIKEIALSFQNGNKPFGEKIPNLLVVTVDLKAFFGGNEHFQHWIEGGLVSMSLMYSFHALGIASCPLNWSQYPKVDRNIRRKLDIKNDHTIIMFIALGYPVQNKVCASTRKPINKILYELKDK